MSPCRLVLACTVFLGCGFAELGCHGLGGSGVNQAPAPVQASVSSRGPNWVISLGACRGDLSSKEPCLGAITLLAELDSTLRSQESKELPSPAPFAEDSTLEGPDALLRGLTVSLSQ